MPLTSKLLFATMKLSKDREAYGAPSRLQRYKETKIKAFKELRAKNNIAKYRFYKNEITAAKLIEELSEKKKIKDISIEEAGIDDIIKIAYGQ